MAKGDAFRELRGIVELPDCLLFPSDRQGKTRMNGKLHKLLTTNIQLGTTVLFILFSLLWCCIKSFLKELKPNQLVLCSFASGTISQLSEQLGL